MEDSNLDLRRLQLEEKNVEQQYQLRVKELELRKDEVTKNRWSSPLVLAIAAAAIGAAGNAYVSWVNSENQFRFEQNKYSAQKESERAKYEADLILEAAKFPDLIHVAAKLKLFIQLGLISDVNRQAVLDAYIKSEYSMPSAPATETFTVPFESGWLGGGHNQTEQCALGRMVVAQQHPGKTILLKSSNEESKKDFLGRVEYKYYCVFEVN